MLASRELGWIVIVAVIAALHVVAVPHCAAQQRDGVAQPLSVAVIESPPFAIKEADGSWSGLAVDLWREIATALGVRYELREVDLVEADNLLGDGSVDAALGAVTITAEDEETHDFSQPYHSGGLGLAEPVAGGTPSFGTVLFSLLNSALLRIAAIIAVATVCVGILITFIERRRNPAEFGGPLYRGIAMGVWWAAVTMTTVGYGDATPKTPSGRGVALLWMFVGVAAVAIFTAAVTSILTVSSMQSTLQRASDIDHLRLGAIAEASGAWYLTRHHLTFKPYEDDESALTGLAHHEVDAVVANIASLRYLVSRQWQGILRVSPIVLEPIVYAIGLPTNSPLREAIDRALLRTIEQERWQDVQHQYLGRQ
jgi:ABC-type amino acid transport substrate-binding protein